MTCSNCNKQIPEDSKFCEHCGEKVQASVKKPAKEDKFEVKDEELKKVVNHLEFLGYEIVDAGSEGELEKILAYHKNKNNIWINKNSSSGFVIFNMFSISGEKVKRSRTKLLEILNTANNQNMLATFSLSEGEKTYIICGSWYPPEYDKKMFAFFLDMFEKDVARGFSTEGLMDFAQ